MSDRPREKCGVVAIASQSTEPARMAFFGLYALQHRGQESAGICTADGESLRNLTGMGLVSQVFHERDLAKLGGYLAIGHTRYSTTGASRPENAQPLVVGSDDLGSLALAHNGNLVNVDEIREEVLRLGARPRTATDSELIAHLIARSPGDNWLARMRHALGRLSGAFCLVMLTRDGAYVARDAWGIRPLVLGRLADGWAAASESCALDTIGAQLIRAVEPGELLSMGPDGIHSEQFAAPAPRRAACSFEYIYFARPDSLVDGQLVYATRERMGEELAREHPVDADFVMPVPDSATPAAIGFARAAGLPYREGLVKNRYIGRTFIQPQQSQREFGVDLKFNPLPEVLRDQRIALVDDSIVRGTTTPRIVAMLRRAGAAEVHLRICAPPIRYACHLGVDTAPEETLIASTHSVFEIQEIVGADSLGYLSLDGLVRAVGLPEDDLCNACFHGRYPMAIDGVREKLAFEAV
ncbi:MAG: amidophosphoribosyltransferase [Chloroflexi bacterium]|nr:amidophosphoribosyltransferase [Chloroflexota bacterium]MBV9600632.1 amidophosphoribosyltransferase [Chloroflexota bacterium]